jgi:hypothetical protein
LGFIRCDKEAARLLEILTFLQKTKRYHPELRCRMRTTFPARVKRLLLQQNQKLPHRLPHLTSPLREKELKAAIVTILPVSQQPPTASEKGSSPFLATRHPNCLTQRNRCSSKQERFLTSKIKPKATFQDQNCKYKNFFRAEKNKFM